jgi:predicted transcriptional regulator
MQKHCSLRWFSFILEGMEVHFSPDIETRLQQVASANGKDAEQLVKDTVARMLEDQDRFVEAVKRGEAALDRGEYLTHEQVGERLRRFLQP